eukprot:839358-Amphidinium_carterae.1
MGWAASGSTGAPGLSGPAPLPVDVAGVLCDTERLGWVPLEDGRRFWFEADHRVKWDSARALCAEVAAARPAFQGFETGLNTQTFQQLKKATT